MIEQREVHDLGARTKSGALTWQTLENGDFQAEDGVRYVLAEKRALWRVWPQQGGLESTTESVVNELARAVSQHALPYTPPVDAPKSSRRKRSRSRQLQDAMPAIERAAKSGRVTQEALQLGI